MSKLSPFAMTLCLTVAACGSDEEPVVDAGPVDSGVVDTPDTGVPSKCPIPGNKMDCETNTACLEGPEQLSSPPSTCQPFCPEYAATRVVSGTIRPLFCATGECRIPETGPQVNLRMSRAGLTRITHFVLVSMHGITTGGERLTCAQVEAEGRTSFFEDACYTVMDVRGLISASNPASGDVFTFSVSRYPASSPVLTVVYGFESDDTSLPPIGFSCTDYDVPAAGAPPGEVTLTDMTLIQ